MNVVDRVKVTAHLAWSLCNVWLLYLHCALASGAVYCNRSCLFVCLCVCLWLCVSITTITRNCVHRSSPNWVCSISSWLNFGRPAPPAGRKYLAPPYYSQRAVFSSLRALFSFIRCSRRMSGSNNLGALGPINTGHSWPLETRLFLAWITVPNFIADGQTVWA